ncbi:hypothetical protein CR513_24666, partial [Mucuna pruriens]
MEKNNSFDFRKVALRIKWFLDLDKHRVSSYENLDQSNEIFHDENYLFKYDHKKSLLANDGLRDWKHIGKIQTT